MPLSIEVKVMDDKEVENEKLVIYLIKSSKSQEINLRLHVWFATKITKKRLMQLRT